MLVKKWEFFLPTAAAILTILYPDEFAIFDWRVCDELNSELMLETNHREQPNEAMV